MLNPSYSNLMKILNEDANADQRITSRYSVVIAAAKRARQIVGGADYEEVYTKSDKAVSIAVNEIQRGHIKIVPGAIEDAYPPHSEHVLQNLPTVIDDNFVSEDIGGSWDVSTEEVEDVEEDWEDDEDIDEDEEEAEDEE